jgi:hypothetical protein
MISDELFHQAQAARGDRYQSRGPRTEWVPLFSGLTHNARDGHPMHLWIVKQKGRSAKRRLISYGKKLRIDGFDHLSISYADFETAVLSFIKEIKSDDLTPTNVATTSELAARRGELAGIDQQLDKLKAALVGGADFDTLKGAITALEDKRKVVRQVIRKLDQAAAVSEGNPVTAAKSILDTLDDLEGDELHDARLKLRVLLSNLIESIHVLPFKVKGRIVAHVQLTFRSGVYRAFTMSPYITQPVSVRITANGKTVDFQAAGGAAGVWDTTNDPAYDLRNYRDKKLGAKLRKKLGV